MEKKYSNGLICFKNTYESIINHVCRNKRTVYENINDLFIKEKLIQANSDNSFSICKNKIFWCIVYKSNIIVVSEYKLKLALIEMDNKKFIIRSGEIIGYFYGRNYRYLHINNDSYTQSPIHTQISIYNEYVESLRENMNDFELTLKNVTIPANFYDDSVKIANNGNDKIIYAILFALIAYLIAVCLFK